MTRLKPINGEYNQTLTYTLCQERDSESDVINIQNGSTCNNQKIYCKLFPII